MSLAAGARVLVTGAGSGIGRGLCVALHAVGAHVVAVSKTGAKLESLKEELKDRCDTYACDLEQLGTIKGVFESIGDVDYLVNNAGTSCLDSFVDMKVEEDLLRIFKVNVASVAAVSQVVAKSWIARGHPGSIVNISSQASSRALPQHTAYCTSKAALDHLSRMMALELGEHKIRVNCVNPTVVMTEMGKMAWSDPAKADPMLARIPLRKFAEVSDVVAEVIHLLTAPMISGACVPIDGGFLVS